VEARFCRREGSGKVNMDVAIPFGDPRVAYAAEGDCLRDTGTEAVAGGKVYMEAPAPGPQHCARTISWRRCVASAHGIWRVSQKTAMRYLAQKAMPGAR
jgi:hypothetical protein